MVDNKQSPISLFLSKKGIFPRTKTLVKGRLKKNTKQKSLGKG